MAGSESKTYQAACVQFDIVRGDVRTNLATAEAGIRDAVDHGAELIVLPEMWNTSFLPEPDSVHVAEAHDADRRITELSSELGVMIVGGGLDQDPGKPEFYNRSLVMDRGTVLGVYRKVHMFSPNAENRIFEPGGRPLVLDTRLGRIGVAICYDIRFPELIRYYFHEGVQVLAVPAQWPEARADHWNTMTKARAIENQMFVLGCNRIGTEDSLRGGESLVFAGDSRIIDPMGHVLATAAGEARALMSEIELRRCRAMQRILPLHQDRRPDVYRELWRPLWEDPATPKVPEVPTVEPHHGETPTT